MMFSPLHNNTVSHAVKRRDSGPLLTSEQRDNQLLW